MRFGGFDLEISKMVQRVRNAAVRYVLARLLAPRDPELELEKLGDADGSWIVPIELLGPNSICYCVGVGENISFDLALIDRLGCDVYAFDPTPRAKQHVAKAATHCPKFHFDGIGVWHRDERVRFYEPRDPSHVSHSAVNLQRTKRYFEADCQSLRSIMRGLGHESLDLLKLDIEGSEHLVLDSLLDQRIAVRVLCVEFDQPIPIRRLFTTLKKLRSASYRIVSIDRLNYTFVLARDLSWTRPSSSGA